MPSKTRLLFIAGSAREGSYNKKLARLGARVADANGLEATFADLGDYPMPLYDADLQAGEGIPENALKLEALMKVHTGIFIASPEYNASISPLLKNSLDWVSRIRRDGEEPLAVFKTRVFALGAASPGGMGGDSRPGHGAYGAGDGAQRPRAAGSIPVSARGGCLRRERAPEGSRGAGAVQGSAAEACSRGACAAWVASPNPA